MARAINSFPVPVSPVMRTVESVRATLMTPESTACNAGDVTTISSNTDTRSALCGRASPTGVSCRTLMIIRASYDLSRHKIRASGLSGLPAVWPVTTQNGQRVVQACPNCSDILRSLVFPAGARTNQPRQVTFVEKGLWESFREGLWQKSFREL